MCRERFDTLLVNRAGRQDAGRRRRGHVRGPLACRRPVRAPPRGARRGLTRTRPGAPSGGLTLAAAAADTSGSGAPARVLPARNEPHADSPPGAGHGTGSQSSPPRRAVRAVRRDGGGPRRRRCSRWPRPSPPPRRSRPRAARPSPPTRPRPAARAPGRPWPGPTIVESGGGQVGAGTIVLTLPRRLRARHVVGGGRPLGRQLRRPHPGPARRRRPRRPRRRCPAGRPGRARSPGAASRCARRPGRRARPGSSSGAARPPITGVSSGASLGTLTEVAGAPAMLAFSGSPAGGSGGITFTTQPAVAVRDQFGNPVTTATPVVDLAITGGHRDARRHARLQRRHEQDGGRRRVDVRRVHGRPRRRPATR